MNNEETQHIDDNSDGESLYQRLLIKVDKGQDMLRIDKFLKARIEYATRNKIQNAIDAGMVTVNGKPIKSNYKIKPADEIIVYTDEEPDSSDIVPEELPLKIVYEDEHLLVVNKAAGMVVHPGSGNYSGTLINGVAHYLIQKDPSLTDKLLPRFGLVHRIDKNTTGLLLLAKTDLALQDLAKQFFNHSIDREYVALVWGDVEQDEGTIVAHVGRNIRHRKLFEAYPDGDHGKEAITHYKVIQRFHYVTLVKCVLETGRTHQIRVHMKHIGHTLFNDDTYGGDRILKGTVYTKYKQFVDNCFTLCPRQALHAKTLGFKHPATGERMLFESDIPTDIAAVIEKWEKYYKVKGKLEEDHPA